MSRIQLRPALRAYAHAPAADTGVAWVNEKSMAFDGSDDYFTTAYGGGLPTGSVANPCSISFWARANADFDAYTIFLSSQGLVNATPTYKFRLYMLTVPLQEGAPPGGGNRFYGWIEGDTSGGWSSSDMGYFVDGTWVHVVFTDLGLLQVSPPALNIYVNGVNRKTATGVDTTAFLAQRLSIGGTDYNGSASYSLASNFDEVAVWRSHVLSPTEVTNIYNSGAPTDLENTSGVTAPDSYWRMGDLDDTDGAGGTIKDRIGSYDMTAGSGNGGGAPAVSSDVPT